MVTASSFIVGMKADITYGRLSKTIRQKNKGCISCNAAFTSDSKVHKLACGHIFHVDCGNQIFSEAAESKYLKQLIGVKMACADPCSQEIQFDEENMKRGWELKEKLLKMTPDQFHEYIEAADESEKKFINEFFRVFVAGAIKINKRQIEKINTQQKNITRAFAFVGFLAALVFAQIFLKK